MTHSNAIAIKLSTMIAGIGSVPELVAEARRRDACAPKAQRGSQLETARKQFAVLLGIFARPVDLKQRSGSPPTRFAVEDNSWIGM